MNKRHDQGTSAKKDTSIREPVGNWLLPSLPRIGIQETRKNINAQGALIVKFAIKSKTGLVMHTIAFLLPGWPTMIPTKHMHTVANKNGSDQSPDAEPSHGATLQKRRGGRARTSPLAAHSSDQYPWSRSNQAI